MKAASDRLRVLHVTGALRHTSMALHEFGLPQAERYAVSFCTYFRVEVGLPDTVRLFEGDATPTGFLHTLRRAWAAGPYDIVHLHTPHLGQLFMLAALFGWIERQHTVYTVHNSYPNYKWRNRALLLPNFAYFRRVVCCSQASYDSFPALFKRAGGARLVTIPNGVNMGMIDQTLQRVRPAPAPDQPFTILWIGRLVPIKNPDLALRAVAALQDEDIRIIFIGEGTERAALEASARALGLTDRVQFTGLIPREQVFAHLAGADLYLSTSRGEGLPIAVLEALTARRPAVLSDIAPHREIAQYGDFLPLVKVDDVGGFAAALRSVLRLPVEARAALGQRGRDLVQAHFSLERMLERYDELYRHLLKVP